MRNIIISTDNSCDLPYEELKKLDIRCINIKYYLNGAEQKENNMDYIYQKMQSGIRLTTSQVNEYEYTTYFENLAQEGKEILHIGLSSGLSGMFNSCVHSINNLKDKYKIHTVDTLNGSFALAILLKIACQMADDGETAETIIAKIEELKNNVCSIVTAAELKYLFASGRLNRAQAAIGTLLRLMPIIRMSDDGKLHSIAKTIGRRKALLDLLSYFDKHYKNYLNMPIYIAHAISEDDAMFIKQKLEEKNLNVPIQIMPFGPIIGGHCGPGTIAIFFTSNGR